MATTAKRRAPKVHTHAKMKGRSPSKSPSPVKPGGRAIKKPNTTTGPIASRSRSTDLYHGSAHRLRPSDSLKPSNSHAKSVGQDKRKHLKGVYFTDKKHKDAATTLGAVGAMNARKSKHHYNYKTKKKPGKGWNTPKDKDPRLKGLTKDSRRDPKQEVMTRQKIKPDTVQRRRVGLKEHEGMLWATSFEDHNYAHRGKKLKSNRKKGKRSKLAHDNLPTHNRSQQRRTSRPESKLRPNR